MFFGDCLMGNLLGEKLVEKKGITPEQLKEALEHQRIHGGRLGDNIVKLGFLGQKEIVSYFKAEPKTPTTLEESSLSKPYIEELILKHAINLREFTLSDLSKSTKLPVFIINEIIDSLRKDHLIAVKGATQLSKLSYTFNLSQSGIQKATELLNVSSYSGPAPVAFKDYLNVIEIQTVKSIIVNKETIRASFSDLVLTDSFFQQIGPAVSSGKSLFLYGPPGNGKTTIAEKIGDLMPDEIYVPYAVNIEGEIITIFDQVTHEVVKQEPKESNIDQRWIKIKRPVIMAGGEMTLKNLELYFNPISNFYEAPLQMKANNGIFIVDDFGRQQIDSQVLLNRWIVPLARRTDYLTLHTGKKIEIPFDQLVIFSTNLEPKDLADEAFLRRIRYKIKIDHPGLKEFKKIFIDVCNLNSIEYDESVFNFLINDLYKKQNVKFNACHCRDLLDWVIDHAHFDNIKPILSKKIMKASWQSYFVEM